MFKLKGRRPSHKRIRAYKTEFRALVRDYCLSVGGIEHAIGNGGVLVPTVHGPLWVHLPWLPEDDAWSDEFVDVMARFEDLSRALAGGVHGLSRHCAKWNHHMGLVRDGQPPAECFAYWQRQLAPMLPQSPESARAGIEECRATLARWEEERIARARAQ